MACRIHNWYPGMREKCENGLTSLKRMPCDLCPEQNRGENGWALGTVRHRQGEKGGREQSYRRKEKKNWKINRQNQQKVC